MAISRKPQSQPNGTSVPAVDVEALINKGGTVAAPPEPAPADRTATVNLRIPVSLIDQIDRELRSRPIKTPRHTWLLEAVVEKLGRESA